MARNREKSERRRGNAETVVVSLSASVEERQVRGRGALGIVGGTPSPWRCHRDIEEERRVLGLGSRNREKSERRRGNTDFL
jgi:hypothetical protein